MKRNNRGSKNVAVAEPPQTNDVSPAQQAVARLPQIVNASVADRCEMGRSRRGETPRAAHEEWEPPADRDPLALLEASNTGREEGLIPIRHQRMLASAFTFYRGAPAIMAYDLAHTPNSGVIAQLCGDCQHQQLWIVCITRTGPGFRLE